MDEGVAGTEADPVPSRQSTCECKVGGILWLMKEDSVWKFGEASPTCGAPADFHTRLSARQRAQPRRGSTALQAQGCDQRSGVDYSEARRWAGLRLGLLMVEA